MKFLVRWFLKQRLLSALITVFLILVGLAAVSRIHLDLFPPVNFDIVTVNTLFPGATPEQVEKLITSPLESELKTIKGVKQMKSSSWESISSITLWFDPDKVSDVDEQEKEVLDIIDSFKKDLPEGAEDPELHVLNSHETPIIELAFTSDLLSELALRRHVKEIKEQLLNLKEVASVGERGIEKLEMQVLLDLKKMEQYQVSFSEVVSSLRLQNRSLPAGSLIWGKGAGASLTSLQPFHPLQPLQPLQPFQKDLEKLKNLKEGEEIYLRVSGDLETTEDVESTVIRANAMGQAVRVRDVAKVLLTTAKKSQLYLANGKPSMGLIVVKSEREDVIDLVDNVKAEVQSYLKHLNRENPATLQVDYINDFSVFIRRRLSVLVNNFSIGFLLVLLILSLSLPFSSAVVAAFGVPVVFLTTMIYFYHAHLGLNLISMMGLIIVVGMLVDDAVVIVENIQRKRDEGLPLFKACHEGVEDIWQPVAASVFTTIFAFAPMLFMTGIFGKFVYSIPLGVISSLLFSLLEAYFILPHHIELLVTFLNVRKPKKLKGLFYPFVLLGRFWNVSLKAPLQNLGRKGTTLYIRLLQWNLRFRYIVLAGVFLFLVGTFLFAKNQMKFILFPSKDVDFFSIQITADVGSSLERTRKLIQPIETLLSDKLSKAEMESFVSRVGVLEREPNDPHRDQGSHYAQIMVYLTPYNQRDRSAYEIINLLKKKLTPPYPEGIQKVLIEVQKGGPPVGKAVQLAIRGRHYKDIQGAVAEVEEFLQTQKGTQNIESDFNPGKNRLKVYLDSVKLASAQLNVAQVGVAMRRAYEGEVATHIRELDEEIDVRVSLMEKYKKDFNSAFNLKIANFQNSLVPIQEVAIFKSEQGIRAFRHGEGLREISIFGSVDEKITSSRKVNAALKVYIDKELKGRHPNLSFHFGGEEQDTQESMQSLGYTFLMAVFGIFSILILTFRNFFQPFLILFTIPLGLFSAIWVFFFHGEPLSFLAMIGLIALSGIIVNNGIVLLSFVNKQREKGEDLNESILSAARLRLRPIFLTTVTTVAGIMPTAYGIGGSDLFVVPIALALAWGVLCGSIFTVFILPVNMRILDDGTRLLKRFFCRFILD